jgi:hypothetical protein
MILCECGEFIEGNTFKDYIKTSANPSTSAIGHSKCGLIFNFIDNEKPKKYSTRKELKRIAFKYAEIQNFNYEIIERFLVEVDRLKSTGKLSDYDILVEAIQRV